MRYYELITEDYKTVTKKFIDAGADSAEVDKYITQFKALGTKLNNIEDPADKNIEAWGKRPFADFKKFVTDIRTQVTLGSQKKDSGTSIDITPPAQRAAGWNIIIPTDKSASCYYGTGTNWCVSKHNQDHFESYFLDKAYTLIFCLNDQQEKWAIACHVSSESEFFNATNTSITQKQFDSATGLNSAKIIQSALSHAGVEPARAESKLTSIPYLIKQLKSPDPALERKILVTKNAQWAYDYALKFKPGGWPAAEPAIAREAEWAYYYAHTVLKAPFPAGEPAIAQDAAWAYEYARYVLKAPWPAAEPAIVQDAKWAYWYALMVLKAPWPAAEPAIAQDAQWAYWYAWDLLKKPWPKAEPVIAQDAQWAVWYALKFKPGGWPAAEPVIAQDAEWAVRYAQTVLKAPWPAGEPAIAQNASWAYEYARYVLKKRFPAAEPVIAQDAEWAYEYAREVLEDPKPKTWGERYLAQHK